MLKLFKKFVVSSLITGTSFTSTLPVSATSSAATDVIATASTTSAGAVDVTWTNATSNPQPTGYLVVPLKNDVEVSSLVVQVARNGLVQTTRTVTGLTDGIAYTFRVDAVYLSGDPVRSTQSASATPYDVPATPTLVATAGNGKVTLSWTAVDNKGSAVSAHIVSVTPTLQSEPDEISGTATTTEITGLTNGTKYSFTLKAKNLRGDGAASAPVTATPVGPPATMIAPTVSAGDGAATVSWTAPTDTGGAEIISYTITGTSSTAGAKSPVTKTVTVSSLSGVLSTQVTELTNSMPYSFTITATNGSFASSVSPSSSTVTPSSAPPAAISAALPKYSAISGGELISFSGSNLVGSTMTALCSDGSTPGVTPIVAETLVTVQSPACPVGLAQLTLSNGGNVVKIHDLTYLSAPTISSISPSSVTSTGASTVTISGTNFSTGITSETQLRVGGTLVTPTSVSASSLTFRAPILINGANLGDRNVQVILGSASGTLSASTVLTYTASGNQVTFSDIPTKRYGSSAFTVTASATAGAVTITSNTPTICTVSGSIVTVVAAGTCRLVGNTPGNTIYASGTSEKVIVIDRGSQTLTAAPTTPQSVGSSTTVLVTNSAGVNGGSISYQSSTTAVCTVSSAGLVVGISPGDCVIVITASETGNFSSTSVTTTFSVTAASVPSPASGIDPPNPGNGGGSGTPESSASNNLPTAVNVPAASNSGTSSSVNSSPSKVRKGKVISVRSLASNAGITVTSGAKVALSISASSKSVCSIVGGVSIRGLKKGNCRVTIKVTPKKTAKVRKPKTVTKSVTVEVS